MAYRSPVFYFYHAGRQAQYLGNAFSFSSAITVGAQEQLVDDLEGPQVTLTDALQSGAGRFDLPLDGSTESQAVDTVVIGTHNWFDTDVMVKTLPNAFDLIGANRRTTEANGTRFSIPLTQNVPYADQTQMRVSVTTTGAGTDSIVPSVGELFFTIARQMTRGPMPNWDHPWVRSQAQFETPAGVSHSWKTGTARKTF